MISILMIIEDLFAILESVNINDKSILGFKNLEIEILLNDWFKIKTKINILSLKKLVLHDFFDINLLKNILKLTQ